MPARSIPASSEDVDLPVCALHPGSLVRRYRSHGPDGPGVYPQCVPGRDVQPHLLEWPRADPDHLEEPAQLGLSPSELEVLLDAAAGLTMHESAAKQGKGSETVKTQRRSILLKLGARNMAHAVGISMREQRLGKRAP